MADYILYVVVNTDLESMTPGKAQAHSGHAASRFAYTVSSEDRMKEPFLSYFDLRGFGTQINLKAKNGFFEDVDAIIKSTRVFMYYFGSVIDPTYPYSVTPEIFELLPKKLHTSEPKYDAVKKVYHCTREECTAWYFFLEATEENKAMMRERLELHP